ILGLLELDDVRQKICAFASPKAAQALLNGSTTTADKLRKYLMVRTQMSVTTGLLVWALTGLIGLPLAAEWGVIAFTLNYIPFIGPFIATLLPTMAAMTQFESWWAVLELFGLLNIIQFITGSYIEPRVSGTVLSVSPFVVLFSVFFWTFLWGLFGAFIGVPITMAILTFCAQYHSSRWIAGLLGGPMPTEAAKGQLPAARIFIRQQERNPCERGRPRPCALDPKQNLPLARQGRYLLPGPLTADIRARRIS